LMFSFFFQAEDGIRDRNVTGVQTCALPISLESESWEFFARFNFQEGKVGYWIGAKYLSFKFFFLEANDDFICLIDYVVVGNNYRSEERRVGKECRSQWASDHYEDARERAVW